MRAPRPPAARLSAVLAACALFSAPSPARADDDAPVVVVVASEPGPGAERAREALEARARALGRRVLDAERAPVDLARPDGAIEASAVAELEAALGGLGRARELAGRLEERAALGILARARERLDALLALPGASRWAAEVEVAIALVAHQAGAAALAERSLRAAATLDPSRAIGGAEAPPELVARGRAIAEEVAGGPRGAFRLEVDAPRARAFLDEVALEPASAREGEAAFAVVGPVGEHVLRVEAEGRLPYARRIAVYEGARAPIRVRLAPDPRVLGFARALAAARRGELEALVAALGASGVRAEVWAAVASPSGARALVARCTADGCARSERHVAGRVAPSSATEPFGDRAFLAEPPPRAAGPEERPPRLRRALLVGAAVLAVAGGATGAVLASRRAGTNGLSATIDFGGLGLLGR